MTLISAPTLSRCPDPLVIVVGFARRWCDDDDDDVGVVYLLAANKRMSPVVHSYSYVEDHTDRKTLIHTKRSMF